MLSVCSALNMLSNYTGLIFVQLYVWKVNHTLTIVQILVPQLCLLVSLSLLSVKLEWEAMETFLFISNKIYLWDLRAVRDFGAHLIQSLNFMGEETGTWEVKQLSQYPTVTKLWAYCTSGPFPCIPSLWYVDGLS